MGRSPIIEMRTAQGVTTWIVAGVVSCRTCEEAVALLDEVEQGTLVDNPVPRMELIQTRHGYQYDITGWDYR